MKGFPNQIADIDKLTTALDVLSAQIAQGESTDDGSFGRALLFQGVIKPGRSGYDINAYIERMNNLPPSNQSHRTTARGIKEMFIRTELVMVTEGSFQLSKLGETLLSLRSDNDVDGVRQHWGKVMWNATARDEEGESHPYRIMLRILASHPGTSRALCALALEARDDSEEEFQRILSLLELEDEDTIRASIGATKSNWDNAKKIIPSIAEQVGQVAKSGNKLYLVEVPEAEADSNTKTPSHTEYRESTATAKPTSPDTIAEWRPPDLSDETFGEDWQSPARAIEIRVDRTIRHNLVVRQLAQEIVDANAFWENPIDLLVAVSGKLLLAEVKTLDGSYSDEVRQVRSAASQLLYYEHFSLPEGSLQEGVQVEKLAVFESRPSDRHIDWMRNLNITSAWITDGKFTTCVEYVPMLSAYMQIEAE
ncbi:MAG: hypothetical protein OXH22_08575 [Chloroflexi bacterium]|nr:hypothetical protein [Chloroflexota bacterium]